MMRAFLKLVMGLMMVSSVSSCQQKGKKSATSYLRLNFQQGEVPSCHPFLSAGHMRGRTLGKLLFEGLTRIDSTGEPALAGAKEVQISSDKTRYTFLLRDNHWSDGSEVTADHYVSAWRHALTPGSNCPRADFFYLIKNGQKAKKGEISIENIGVQALDSKTLMVELENPSSHFLSLLAQPLFAPLKQPEEDPKIFNGPFKIGNWIKGVSIQLEANSCFWNCRHVPLNGITIDYVEDQMTATYMYEKGQIDWIGEPLSALTKESTLELVRKNQALFQPVDRFFWIYLNTHQSVLKSQKIRKALSLSIERKQIVDHVCVGGEPILTPVPAAMISYSRFQTQREDLELAKRLFSEGLQELDLIEAPCIVLSYIADASRKQIAEYLKERWEDALGLTIKLQGCEWNVLNNNLERGNFEIGGCMASAFYGDPLEFLDRFETLGNGNFPQWESDAFKEKLSLIRQEVNEQKRMDLLAEAEKILVDEMPIIPVYHCVHAYAHNPALKGYVLDGGGCVDFAYSRLNLD